MSLTRKGSRTINVGNDTFYWHVRRKPTYEQGLGANLTVAIQLKGTNNSVLVVTCNGPRPDAWVKENEGSIVTPKHIKEIINKASSSGWEFNKKGNSFEFCYEIT